MALEAESAVVRVPLGGQHVHSLPAPQQKVGMARCRGRGFQAEPSIREVRQARFR